LEKNNMNFLKQLILLNLNIILTTNLIFSLLIPSILVRASEVVVETSQDAEANKLLQEVEALLGQNTREAKQQVIILLQKVLTFYEKSGNTRGQTLILLRIANIHNDLGQKEEALAYYEKSLAIAQSLEDQSLQGNILINIGLVYYDRGKKEEALAYYEKSLVIAQSLGDQSLQSKALNNIANVYLDRKDGKKALEFYQKSLEIAQSIKDTSLEGKVLNNIGYVYYAHLGEKEKALEYYEKSLAIAQLTKNYPLEAMVLRSIGNIYVDLGDNQQALEFYQKSLAISESIGDRSLEGKILVNLGVVYNNLGEQEKALEYYQESLLIARSLGDRSAESRRLHNIGLVYNYFGEWEKALDIYQESLTIAQSLGDRTLECKLLKNIGDAYDGLEEKEPALEYYEKSLIIAQSIGDQTLEALVLNGIGNIYGSLLEYEKALSYYQKFLTIAENLANPLLEVAAMMGVGSVYNDLGEPAKALEFLQTSLTMLKAKNLLDIGYGIFGAIADVQLKNGQLDSALINIKEAVATVEKLRTKIVNQDARIAYFLKVQGYYELYIDILMQLDQTKPNQGYAEQALTVSERTKARNLLELLTESQVDVRQGVNLQLLEQEKYLIRQLNQAEENRLKYSVNVQKNSRQLEEINEKIEQILTELTDIRSEIKKTNPHYNQLMQPEPLTVQQIQDQLLDDQTVLLEYFIEMDTIDFVGTNTNYLWVISKNSLNTYTIPKTAELKEAVNQLREVLTNPRTQNNQALVDQKADQLTNMILAPAAQEIKGKRLLVVADGPLQYIPFSALSLPGTTEQGQGYQPLISQQAVINLPSAATLAMIRQDSFNRPLAPKKLAVIADPVFSPDDDRLSEIARNKLKGATSVTTDISRGTDNAGITWQRLPFTRQEAEAISNLMPVSDSQKVLDFQANYATVTQGDLSQYQIIHFATHGFINTEKPELSAIVLSLIDQAGNWENGYLRLNDIFNLNLPAELVVLSACQTGLGKEIKGEGLVGLTRGFMYAGAKRVLVSLWNVNDQKTAELMTLFYEKMLKDQLSPVEALRIAQVVMWQKGDSPYYWAPFIFQGEPDK
jgi:CHAT domain-containing protein/predicted negative regulator of RcsB-dependent stress response